MNVLKPMESAGARIVDSLHNRIADLIDGNQVKRSEVINAGARSCACHLIYTVEWTFVPNTSQRRLLGNAAVSTHFGFDQTEYAEETSKRCNLGRTHKPVREKFVKKVLAGSGNALADAEIAKQVWDFGQHSVHQQCALCSGGGQVRCISCNNGRVTCSSCNGRGATTQTRYVPGHNGQGHNESYMQSCYGCGGAGSLTCYSCGGSCRIRCGECGGHGFFTDITSVTLNADPQIRITVRAELSQDALSKYLVSLPVTQVVHYFDFLQVNHADIAPNKWQVGYEARTTVAELDVSLRGKSYLAAAVSDKALAFIRPPIFDDVFIEEITDLKKIWAGKKKSLRNERARRFFAKYSGQPVLDAAMKSVAKLKGPERELPGKEVSKACDEYISSTSADLLGKFILALLDKVSPPNSLWSWIGVMAFPFLLMFLGAQNWIENNVQRAHVNVGILWLLLAVSAALVTLFISPVAAVVSTFVSAIRRSSVPVEYQQHGRNWQPLRSFIWASVAVASLGGAIGMLTHYEKLPRWNNLPMTTIEKVLSLNRFAYYTQLAAPVKEAGVFVPPRAALTAMPEPARTIFAIQANLRRLGYQVPVTGQMDSVTRQTVVAYAKMRKLKTTEPQVVLTSLCKDIPGACTNAAQLSY